MIEKNLRFCKKCQLVHERIEAGRYPNGKDKKWRDETGKLWSGNICGSCNNSRVKETMKLLRHGKTNQSV